AAYLETLNTARALDELEAWEFSRFVFDFLETEVFDPEARQAARKRQVLATVVALYGHLARTGEIRSSEKVDDAFKRICWTSHTEDAVDPTDLLGGAEPDKRLQERARRYFYSESAPGEPGRASGGRGGSMPSAPRLEDEPGRASGGRGSSEPSAPRLEDEAGS